MGTDIPSSPRPATARATAVAGFYAAVAVAGFFWHATAQDTNDIWRVEPGQALTWSFLGVLLGTMLGLVVVHVFRALEPWMAWLPALHREFRAIFGRPSNIEIVLLAAASALGEELLFRGAMLDAWGITGSSIVFALLHIPPRASLWPWTLSAFVLGLLLAGVTLTTGNLSAAVFAHFVINLQNLRYITRHSPAVGLSGPVRPTPSSGSSITKP